MRVVYRGQPTARGGVGGGGLLLLQVDVCRMCASMQVNGK